MYVVGSVDENEIMLYNVILALRDSLHLLFKYVISPILALISEHTHFRPIKSTKYTKTSNLLTRNCNRQTLDRRTLHENFDLLSLAIDEIIDDGIILETDPTIIVQRVSKAPSQDAAQLKGIDLSEQGMNNLASFGKAKLGDWLRQGL